MNKNNLFTLFQFLLLAIYTGIASAQNPQPFADAHIHYNWDQAEIISAQAVVKILAKRNVGLTLVSATPSHLALELREAGGDWIVPFFSPYTHALGRHDWYRNQSVVEQAASGLAQGLYFGIGEIHFMVGFLPRPDNAIFLQLMALAGQHRVPALIHVDAANDGFFLGICKAHPQVRIMFAHAGGNLKPPHIRSILEQCPNVWIDFAARDDWRYGGLTDANSLLLPAWKQLVLDFPNRFVTGTDPVWRVTRTQSWDQADDGWDYYDLLFNYHQTWLADLPANVRQKIAWDNVRQLLEK